MGGVIHFSGQFTLIRDVCVVDCSRDMRLWPTWVLSNVGEEMPAEKRELAVWGEINHALSSPVTPNDSVTGYVPTQIFGGRLLRSRVRWRCLQGVCLAMGSTSPSSIAVPRS